MIECDYTINVDQVLWETDQASLQQIRQTVFVIEQQVPASEEWDEFDALAWHFLAQVQLANGDLVPVGTGRLLQDGKIGRMAVLATWRNRGVGGKILQTILHSSPANAMAEFYLHAQVSAIAFYQRHGFVAIGNQYDEAGIRHQTMVLIK